MLHMNICSYSCSDSWLPLGAHILKDERAVEQRYSHKEREKLLWIEQVNITAMLKEKSPFRPQSTCKFSLATLTRV